MILKVTKIGVVLVTLLAIVGISLDNMFPPDLSRYEDQSVVVLDADGNILRAFTTSDDMWRLPTRSSQVDPIYIKMLLAFEDKRFFSHPGVDPLALVRALWQWVSTGRVVSGASTLTMQTARLVEPRQRNLLGKLIEMARALQLEWRFSKDEILQMYLTLAPFGGNLEGARAASLAYFNKEPTRLTAAEAALLVALPQSPSFLRPDLFPVQAGFARAKVLVRLEKAGVLTSRHVMEALEDPVRGIRHNLPFLAPHFSRHLKAISPGQKVHSTFIDRTLQDALEGLGKRTKTGVNKRASIAIMVVEDRTRKILAYLGSADFFDEDSSGQVDMVRAVRSPGSTLKPFIYGMGFDDSVIHPETMISDVPTRFGDYFPRNFTGGHRGDVTIREALQQSLNIPAVAVLNRIGPIRFAATLQKSGIHLRFPHSSSRPGLPVALGGVGITLKDLVTLYVGLANGGMVAPLRLSEQDEGGPGYRIFREIAAWFLSQILQKSPLPDSLVAINYRPFGIPVSFKTGTSFGSRDSWAVGFSATHTVGVWIGRPDGTPSPGQSGLNTAAPLLFKVFGMLPKSKWIREGKPPPGVLSAASGLPERLRRFQPHGGWLTPQFKQFEDELRIIFPPDGSTIEVTTIGGEMKPLLLEANGGVRPLFWTVNGMPVDSSPFRRKIAWSPDGKGFTGITVIDSRGDIASVQVRLD